MSENITNKQNKSLIKKDYTGLIILIIGAIIVAILTINHRKPLALERSYKIADETYEISLDRSWEVESKDYFDVEWALKKDEYTKYFSFFVVNDIKEGKDMDFEEYFQFVIDHAEEDNIKIDETSIEEIDYQNGKAYKMKYLQEPITSSNNSTGLKSYYVYYQLIFETDDHYMSFIYGIDDDEFEKDDEKEFEEIYKSIRRLK